MIIRMRKEVSLSKFYMHFLMHTSLNLPSHRQLTERQMEVLTEFWLLEGSIVDKNRFCSSAKRMIRDKFNYKNYSNLDNFINALEQKGFIYRNEDGNLEIKPAYNLGRDFKTIKIEYLFNVTE